MKKRLFSVIGFLLLGSLFAYMVWPKAFDYSCAFNSNPKIVFGLIRNHVFLAEYKRYVEVDGDRYFLGTDPGGQADVHIYSDGNDWIVVSSDCNWIIISNTNLSVKTDQKDYFETSPPTYVGRATFVNFKWIYMPAAKNEYIKPYVLKGG